jgi:hypothetical protein
MGKKRFTEVQITFAPRQHDGRTAVAEIIRKLGISKPRRIDLGQGNSCCPQPRSRGRLWRLVH